MNALTVESRDERLRRWQGADALQELIGLGKKPRHKP
jgi:hypothetical protein